MDQAQEEIDQEEKRQESSGLREEKVEEKRYKNGETEERKS